MRRHRRTLPRRLRIPRRRTLPARTGRPAGIRETAVTIVVPADSRAYRVI